MEEENRPSCSVLTLGIGSLPLPKIIEHLEECQTCQAELTDAFESYEQYGKTLYSNLPVGLKTKDEFLRAWHYSVQTDDDRFLMDMENVQKKLLSKEYFQLIQLLDIQSRIMWTLSVVGTEDAGRRMLITHLKVLERRWREFRDSFGEQETDHLFGFTGQKSFEAVLDGWKKLSELRGTEAS